MSEYIGLKGILEGVRDMLKTDTESPELLKTRMECAKSILGGVIKELTPPPTPNYSTGTLLPNMGGVGSTTLDPTAEKAKEELL